MQALVYAACPSLTSWQTPPGGVQEAQSTTEFATVPATQRASAMFVRVHCLAAACCQLPGRREG